jgi:hypothetical protein
MKPKTVILIVVPIVVVIVVATVAILLLRGGGIGLPVYPGAQKLATQSHGAQVFEIYYFNGSGPDAYNWYEQQMPSQGWTLYYEPGYSTNYGGQLFYTKENKMATIGIFESPSLIENQEAAYGVSAPSGAKLLFLEVGPPFKVGPSK